MKPTQEQVIAWAREAKGDYDDGVWLFMPEELQTAFTLAHEAGRKDENEACIEACNAVDVVGADDCIAAIRARREQ